MKKFNYLDTIVSPAVTEKATSLSEFNKIVFKVHQGANKKAIVTLKKRQTIDLTTGI